MAATATGGVEHRLAVGGSQPLSPCCSFTHASKSACETTVTGERMVAWPSPQSSVQMSGNRPVFVGVITMLVSMPGTTSCFCPIAGIQNEWITSADCNSKVMLRFTGITSL